MIFPGSGYDKGLFKPFEIVSSLVQGYHGTGRIVVTDNWFGSIRLGQFLWRRGLYLISTLRANSLNIPKMRDDDLSYLNTQFYFSKYHTLAYYQGQKKISESL